ncbi:uncharacterized protein LOC117144969 [Drosophila mauritiana]|uniref:Uncharacterized protein LOC117144969 n=1 Tax=Drosophila mauritiana TaxID=7226 RepID=A0A6P8KST9_DROMA|nr:uncharacterized protein LOC117144969 [Drosophila mauritiana]
MGNIFGLRRQDSTDNPMENHNDIYYESENYSLRRTIPDEDGNIFVRHEIIHAAWRNPAPIRSESHHRSTRPGFGGHYSSVQPIYEDLDPDEGVEDLNYVY